MLGAAVSILLNILVAAISLALVTTILLLLTDLRASKISNLVRLQELYAKLEALDREAKNLESLRQKQAELLYEKKRREEYIVELCARIPRYRDLFIESRGEGVLKAVDTVLQRAISDRQQDNIGQVCDEA